jgi:demethylmenaquinone methyltransferase/2-methoxy-6-polyprenyl-1,4-benzoquinol methylase
MSGDLLAGQAEYYRRRAGEYDSTAYGDLARARARIARLVGAMAPSGRVLEIACGTGLWTEALARAAGALTAIDAAPEMLAIARSRVRSDHATFEVADVFSWTTTQRFDVVFFSAWLSHVPTGRFDEFWRMLRGLLARDGRVLFVDEHVDERGKEAYLSDADEVVERRLLDGTTHRIVKNFVVPVELEQRLQQHGWAGRVRRDGPDWVWGEFRPVRR